MGRQRDRGAEYARRNARARAEGFSGYGQKRRLGGERAAIVRNAVELHSLPPLAQAQRGLVQSILAEARREGRRRVPVAERLTLPEIARREHVPLGVLRFWARHAARLEDGELVPTRADREYRAMVLYSGGRALEADVRGSHQATVISRYHHAIEVYLATGDRAVLRPFEGLRVAGHVLDTDPALVRSMAERGIISGGPYGDAAGLPLPSAE